MGDAEMLEWHRRLLDQHPHICYVAKKASAGCMFSTALIFPYTYSDDLPFRALTLTTFVMSSFILVVLHLEPFLRVGLYTASLTAFILVLLVLLGAPSNKSDIQPWLPLCIVVFCSVTAIIHQLWFRLGGDKSSVAAQGNSVPLDGAPTTGYPGHHSTISEPSGTRPPSRSYRDEPNWFQHMGPGSARSAQTYSGGTDITLRDADGPAPQRYPQAGFLYGNSRTYSPEHTPDAHLSATTHEADPAEAAADLELGHARMSHDSALDSTVPLLAPYD